MRIADEGKPSPTSVGAAPRIHWGCRGVHQAKVVHFGMVSVRMGGAHNLEPPRHQIAAPPSGLHTGGVYSKFPRSRGELLSESGIMPLVASSASRVLRSCYCVLLSVRCEAITGHSRVLDIPPVLWAAQNRLQAENCEYSDQRASNFPAPLPYSRSEALENYMLSAYRLPR